MSDTIHLTIPADTRFRGVATLVLGGIGTRLDVPYERIDDLQLALSSVLEAAARELPVTIEFQAGPGLLSIVIGPLREGTGDDRGLAKVLEPLVDAFHSSRRHGADWLELELGLEPAETPAEPA